MTITAGGLKQNTVSLSTQIIHSRPLVRTLTTWVPGSISGIVCKLPVQDKVIYNVQLLLIFGFRTSSAGNVKIWKIPAEEKNSSHKNANSHLVFRNIDFLFQEFSKNLIIFHHSTPSSMQEKSIPS